ncbi:DUF2855 family protein [Sneathiella aquimaris]|uniref:DUF2855 family protein n=1 Tax=Sneathiella aquimaris TaxID=2599305 RepID=UPI00146C3C62|nr:DUF2855 family protein [Sneathiella aquimaris]
MTLSRWTILIDKDDITKSSLHPAADHTPLKAGQIEVALNRFALTANNITYATLGKSFGSWTDMPGYWAFFPAESETVGQLPVWGFATVTGSENPDIEVGEELYGYFPLSSHLRMTPGHISKGSLVDMTAHRQALAPVYNQYNRVQAMDDLKAEEKDLWPVFRPLLVTGYMICDQFDENGFYGADQILIASASSKTAMMTANSFRLFEGAPKLIGVTSSKNKKYTEKTKLYDHVITYDDISELSPGTKTALIDMAGNGEFINSVHQHFTENLTFSLLVGISHWDSSRPAKGLPGPQPTPFFAPGRIKARSADWGAGGLKARMNAAWDSFAALAPTLTQMMDLTGPQAAKDTYDQLVNGAVDPQKSLLIKV